MKERIIRGCFLFIFLISSGYLLWYGFNTMKINTEYNNLLAEFPEGEQSSDSYYWEEPENLMAIWELINKLKQENEDFRGIVEIPNTKLKYPVVQSDLEDGLYYLNRDFWKQKSSTGNPFMDFRCNIEESSTNTILYGHRMRNGQMFAVLKNYNTKAFWEENPNILWMTEQGVGIYEIFAVYIAYDDAITDENSKYYQQMFINSQDPEEVLAFGEAVKSWSLYNTGIQINKNDTFLTLKTCDYAVKNGRMVVVARCKELTPFPNK